MNIKLDSRAIVFYDGNLMPGRISAVIDDLRVFFLGDDDNMVDRDLEEASAVCERLPALALYDHREQGQSMVQ